MTNNDTPELKPCPFCGGAPVIKQWFERGEHIGFDRDRCEIECPMCCDVVHETLIDASSFWNTRADKAPDAGDITLDDVKGWADGVHAAYSTEYAPRVTDEEGIIATAIINAQDDVKPHPPAVALDRAECDQCHGAGEYFTHSDDCRDDLCALNGDMHSCNGKVIDCPCTPPDNAELVKVREMLGEIADSYVGAPIDTEACNAYAMQVQHDQKRASEALAILDSMMKREGCSASSQNPAQAQESEVSK